MDATVTRIDEDRVAGKARQSLRPTGRPELEISRFDHWDAAPAVMIWPTWTSGGQQSAA